MKYYLVSFRMVIIKKKQEIVSVGEDTEKMEHLGTVGEKVSWRSH